MINFLLLIFILSFIVLLHELGHFTVAKLNHVTVLEFSVGMGPLLYSKTKGDTQYSIRAIPIGGYVKMDGEDGTAEEDDEDAPKYDSEGNFSNKSPWVRLAIMMAGVAVNFVLGILLLFLYFSITGVPSQEAIDKSIIDVPVAGSPAEIAGLQQGDGILKVNGENVDNWDDVVEKISAAGSGEIQFVINRQSSASGKVMEIACSPIKNEEGRYIVGISPLISYHVADTFNASTKIFGKFFTEIFKVLGRFFHKETLSNLVGPVGLYTVVGDVRQSGLVNLIFLAAYLSINIGVLNLLPIPALDGGRAFLVLIELVSGRKINRNIEGALVMGGALMLLALFVFILYNDIVRMITG